MLKHLTTLACLEAADVSPGFCALCRSQPHKNIRKSLRSDKFISAALDEKNLRTSSLLLKSRASSAQYHHIMLRAKRRFVAACEIFIVAETKNRKVLQHRQLCRNTSCALPNKFEISQSIHLYRHL